LLPFLDIDCLISQDLDNVLLRMYLIQTLITTFQVGGLGHSSSFFKWLKYNLNPIFESLSMFSSLDILVPFLNDQNRITLFEVFNVLGRNSVM
jgi:hypothetical protein